MLRHVARARLIGVGLLLIWSAACSPSPQLLLDSPVHGTFVNGTEIAVAGRLVQPAEFSRLTVNGIPVTPAAKWSAVVSVSPAAIFNRITVVGTLRSGGTLEKYATLVVGDGVRTSYVLDGERSPESVSLRITDSGLEQVNPIVESLASGSLDVSGLVTAQNPIAQGNIGGIDYTANVVEAGFGDFGFDVDPSANGLDTNITIDDLFVEIDLDLGWLGGCTLEVESESTAIGGSFDVQPLASEPSRVDVDVVSPVTVSIGGFGSRFVSGICDDVLIGDIVNAVVGQGRIHQLMQDGFQSSLADPDGVGPSDSPLASAIEQALAGISITGPLGSAIGGVVDAPIASLVEDGDGLTLVADTAFTTAPAPGAPDLPASFTFAESAPAFGTVTPDQGLPYGMAFAISTSAVNQLLKTQIENGLLRSEIADLLGTPIQAGILSLLIPGLESFDPTEPVVVRVRPTLAPILTNTPGPNGELATLKIAALAIDLLWANHDETFLSLQVDMDTGVEIAFTPAGLELKLKTPPASAIDARVVANLVSANEGAIVNVFRMIFPRLAPEIENAIEAFPIPSFLGLDLQPVEVARLPGGFLGFFANLAQQPTTHVANVTFTDLSNRDFREQGGCWLREWRHRLAGNVLGNTISADLRGMLGADAGCVTNDASSAASLSYRIDFEVVGAPGEQWTLDLGHSIRGSFDRISDGANDGILFRDGGGIASIEAPVSASYAITGQPGSSFDFTPSVTSINDGVGGPSSNQSVEFGGAAGTVIQGRGDATVSITYRAALFASSNSRAVLPTANGDEMAIRLGKNDTIDDDFTAGEYPGMGERNIAGDGHAATIVLTSEPIR